MRELTYTGEVKDGVLKIVRRARFDAEIKELEGKGLIIKISRFYKKRTLRENAFYHGYFLQYEIDCFYEFWGERYDKQQVHEFNKVNFFGDTKVIEKTGEIIRVPGSSAQLSTVDFETKLEDIRQWFRQNFEFEIPYPNDNLELPL